THSNPVGDRPLYLALSQACARGLMILFSAHGVLASALPEDGRSSSARTSRERSALDDLERIGFVQRGDEGGEPAWRWRSKHPAGDRALLGLLARFDLDLELGLAADETVWIAAAIQRSAAREEREAFSGSRLHPA